MRILLIEDDPDDIEVLQYAFSSRNIDCSISTISDGGEALKHINSSKDYPDVLVLDLNLPKVHGREILRVSRSVPGFREVPILILTTSSADRDREFASQNGAAYLIKPTHVDQIDEIVHTIVKLAEKNKAG